MYAALKQSFPGVQYLEQY